MARTALTALVALVAGLQVAAAVDCPSLDPSECFGLGFAAGRESCDAPTPAPMPMMSPPFATVTGDPHFMGFSKQSFDFTGHSGGNYALISDENLAINARFGEAYTTGGFVDKDTLQVTPMYAKGTWMTAMAFILGQHTIEISTEDSSFADICPTDEKMRNQLCFFGGTVKVDGVEVIRPGVLPIGDNIEVYLENSKSFGRMTVRAPSGWKFIGDVDFVPPKAEWKITDGATYSLYSHLNFKIRKIVLSPAAHGIIGQTSVVKFDVRGQPILKGMDMNGKGIIDGKPEDYELSSLLSTDFAFSAFEANDDVSMMGYSSMINIGMDNFFESASATGPNEKFEDDDSDF